MEKSHSRENLASGEDDKRTMDAITALCKLFAYPIPNPCPQRRRSLPSCTEVLRNEIEEDYVPYSPVMWADPLIPYAITAGSKRVVASSVPAVRVAVNQYSELSISHLEISALGLQIKAPINSRKGTINDLMPGIRINNPLATLMNVSNVSSSACDEAAIVRLLLLQAITISPVDQVCVSDCPYLFALNCRVKRESCTTKWMPPLKEETQRATSTLFCRTLHQYAALFSGYAQEDYSLKDESNKRIDYSDAVYIPVKSCWRGQPWLLPYILSFTTTLWWNHSVVISVEMENMLEDEVAGQSLKYDFMPRASTVYIPGDSKWICLVVVDSPFNKRDYEVCKGITATHDGEPEFAKKVMCYLGRDSDPTIDNIKPTDVTEAINHMCEIMFTQNEFRKMQLRSAILTTSRFCGYGVSPSECDTIKASGVGEMHRSHIGGLYKFNCKEELMVGDFKLPDIATQDENTLQMVLQNRQHWRTDPLGFFACSEVNLSRDKSKIDAVQYQLAESQHTVRVLRACGVFVKEKHNIIQSPEDLFNTTIAYGSLVLGLTNWAAADLGVTLFEHNQMKKQQNCINRDYSQLWPAITQHFFIGREDYQRVLNKSNYHEILGISMNLATLPENISESWYDTHYSWNCPWWYVAAIREKFGERFKVEDDKCYHMFGYLIESKETFFSILTQSCQYGNNVKRIHPEYFSILTQTFDREEKPSCLSFSPNAFTDYNKYQFKSKSNYSMESLNGICELNIVVFPSARFASLNINHQAIVSNSNRIYSTDETTYPFINGGLRYPNICSDWLLQKDFPVLPAHPKEDCIGAKMGYNGLDLIINALNTWNNNQKRKRHATNAGTHF